MLEELVVHNLGVIADARLVLGPGMQVLTGETGAGKTLVVEALGLIGGARADGGAVGPESAEAVVEASFSGCELPEWAGGSGVGDLVISRTVSLEGRNRIYVNGRMATAAQLQELSRPSLAIHGQQTAARLLAPREQLVALDAFGVSASGGGAGAAYGDALESYRSAYRVWRDAEASVAAFGGDPQERAREADRLQYEVSELEAAAVLPGEDAALDDEAQLLESAVELRAMVGEACAAAAEAADGLEAVRALGQARHERLTALASRGESLAIEARDLVGELRAMGETIEENPERLAEVRARIDLLHALKRKYGPALGDVIDYLGDARRRLGEHASREEAARASADALAAAEAGVREAAASLTAARRDAAPKLGEAVTSLLPSLAIPGGAFRVALESSGDLSGVGPSGADAVVFKFSGNPGAPLRPLGKVASGGELARVMLALELVAMGHQRPGTIVFDEVDAGIGGEVAATVGDRLAELADAGQVLCVTHLPQVACHGEGHFRVEKSTGRATVEPVVSASRVGEITRMLAGDRDSAHAKRHARELLEAAEKSRAARRRAGGTVGAGESRATMASRG